MSGLRAVRRAMKSEADLKDLHNQTVLNMRQRFGPSSAKPEVKAPSRKTSLPVESINGFQTPPASPKEKLSGKNSKQRHELKKAMSTPDGTMGCTDCFREQTESEKLRQEVATLKQEVSSLRKDLDVAKQSEKTSRASEKVLKDRISERAQLQISVSGRFEDLSLGENRPSQLIQRYGALYSDKRVEALDALDSIPELSELNELKEKLLFSVIVLAFRACQQKLSQLQDKARIMLHTRKAKLVDPQTVSTVKDLENSISVYLRRSTEWFDLKPINQELSSQIFATLYEYPALQTCPRLSAYTEECVRVAWRLSVQNPSCQLEYESQTFDSAKHTRFHASNGASRTISSFLWPSLMEQGANGVCLYKGVVLT